MARKNISNKKCKIWRGLGLAWDCNICFLHSQMLCFICPRKGSDLSAQTIFFPQNYSTYDDSLPNFVRQNSWPFIMEPRCAIDGTCSVLYKDCTNFVICEAGLIFSPCSTNYCVWIQIFWKGVTSLG
jgi:hypothetical protein